MTEGGQRNASGLSKHRVEALSEGIFAIVMTLLVLEIKVPDLRMAPDIPALAKQLADMWPLFSSYIIGFAILAIFWIGHHAQFHYIHHCDRNLLWINVLFLMVVALVPFSTHLLGSHGRNPLAVTVYGINFIAAGLVIYLHWWYATHNRRLVDPRLSEGIVR